MQSGFAVLGVPIDSAGVVGGTELAPGRLRSLGLIEAVGGIDKGDLDVRIRGQRRNPVTGIVESDQVDKTTRTLRKAVADIVASGQRLLLVGGCCAVVPGALAGARDALGSIGIAHLDGHLDLYDGHTSPSGEAADMPLPVALGVGPESWVKAAGGQSLWPEATWIVGHRDRDEAAGLGSIMPEDFNPPLSTISTPQLREQGMGQAGAKVAADLEKDPNGFWVHLDLDIADPGVFFANDAPVPDGLNWDELVELLKPLLASPVMRGISLACYNPEKDPTGRNGEEIVDVFRRALS